MRAPTSTYRLQITAEQTLFDAAARLEALNDLGVDWVYLSPILAAEPGSTHGYDVVAHDRVDASRGGAEGLAALSAEARRLGMGVLVDIVPNHVGVATPERNAWWWDVLRLGRESAHADAFDVDWTQHDGRILLPIVGDDDALADGRVDHLTIDGDALRYWDTAVPIAPGTEPTEGDDANAVLARQHYELALWRRGDDELNYRRFFAVTTLAAIRVEDRAVFDASHVEIRRWFDEGLVDGLRVDHPDGLRDPEGYLADLADLTGGAYVLVEKILEPGEALPRWATAGTTGYDALALVDRVLTDPAGEAPLGAIEARLQGEAVDWHERIHGTKRRVADSILHAEVLRLEREVRAAHADAPADVAGALAELLACFPVYRSYLPAGGGEHLREAASAAREHRPDLADTIGWLEPVLLDAGEDAARRFQQTSGMVMAKGVEDTAFYRDARLTSLNEVGGDPSVFAVTPDAFHAAMAERQADWPLAMTTLSTHDTKRGEDVRARITTIAEVPEAWDALLERMLPHAPEQDRPFTSLLLQAVVGSWPASADRLHAYAEKAARESDAVTHWTAPDADYEAGLAAFVDACLGAERDAVEAFVASVDVGWRSNVLSAKLLALAMPGVPDVYQGSEVRELSLVDPDNRRPVDWAEADALRERAAAPPDVAAAAADGQVASTEPTAAGSPAVVGDLELAKVRLVRETLRLRRDRPELFGSYAPIEARGAAAEHALAFDRGGAIAVATRLPLGLASRGGWADTTLPLPDGSWTELLSGRTFESGDVPLADLLATLPVALLAPST